MRTMCMRVRATGHVTQHAHVHVLPTRNPWRSTTPGTCGESCKLAATLRIVEGRQWSHSLENPYTEEWQELAEIITEEVSNQYKRLHITQ